VGRLRAGVRRRAGAFRVGFAEPEVFAALVARFAVARLTAGLRAAEERVEPLVEDLARVDVDLRAPVEAREVLARLRVPVALRGALERVEALRPPVERERDAPPELARADPASSVHLPLITRCAASATASAMIEPNLVALDTTLLAACDAVSAASRPASRIARRALGLALIAAAAAANPAASISLLIAALASLSTVALPDDLEEPEELLREDLAIASSPLAPFAQKDTSKL
jgi:hypothetical protein